MSSKVAAGDADAAAVGKVKKTLLIIDPQNDFHPAVDENSKGGSLGVPGANEDSARIAE